MTRLATTETILGWRMWRVLPFKRLDGSTSYRLCAVGTLGVPKVWEPRQPVVAVCSNYATRHEAPWWGHECGMWALKSPETTRRRMVQWMWKFRAGKPAGWAMGQVALWGRVIEHEEGFRAQYAYPFAITVESKDERIADVLRNEYAIDVTWNGSELIAKTRAKKARRLQAWREDRARKDAELEDLRRQSREAAAEYRKLVRRHAKERREVRAQWNEEVASSDGVHGDKSPILVYLRCGNITGRSMRHYLSSVVNQTRQSASSREIAEHIATRHKQPLGSWDTGKVGQALHELAEKGQVRKLIRPGHPTRWLPGRSKLPPEKGWTEVNVRTNEAAVLPPHDPEQLLAALRQAIEEEMQKHPRRRKWSGWARGGAVARILCPGATHIHASEIGLRLRKLAEQGLVRGERDGYSVSNYWQPA